MKKKVELSRNSYLEFEIHVLLYKLVVVNTFDGFFKTKFDPTLDILELKKSLFLFKFSLLWARSLLLDKFLIRAAICYEFVVILRQCYQILVK